MGVEVLPLMDSPVEGPSPRHELGVSPAGRARGRRLLLLPPPTAAHAL